MRCCVAGICWWVGEGFVLSGVSFLKVVLSVEDVSGGFWRERGKSVPFHATMKLRSSTVLHSVSGF